MSPSSCSNGAQSTSAAILSSCRLRPVPSTSPSARESCPAHAASPPPPAVSVAPIESQNRRLCKALGERIYHKPWARRDTTGPGSPPPPARPACRPIPAPLGARSRPPARSAGPPSIPYRRGREQMLTNASLYSSMARPPGLSVRPCPSVGRAASIIADIQSYRYLWKRTQHRPRP
jgi:hypothetical protein